MPESKSTSEVLSWGMGRSIRGTPFRQVVSAAQAGGRLSIIEADMPAGQQVEEHVHEREDQITIVVEGTVGARVGAVEYLLEAGSVAFMPRRVPHSQWNPTASPARVLEVYTPGGFETVFERAGQLALSGQALGPEEFQRLRDEWAASDG